MNRVRLIFRSFDSALGRRTLCSLFSVSVRGTATTAIALAALAVGWSARPALAEVDGRDGNELSATGTGVTSAPAADGSTSEPVSNTDTRMPACACASCASGTASLSDAGTDHQSVVGRWGVEARRVAVLNASGNNVDPRCGMAGPCPVAVNALGVRRWVHERYGWNAALALAAGGGATDGNTMTGGGTWDTHVGVGPIVGANFLLGQARHLAVSALPQFGFLAFLPSGSGSKTFMVDVRALLEAELHLGFVGLPQVSVGASSGLALSWVKKTRGDAQRDRAGGVPGTTTFAAWDVGFVGPQSLWGLFTQSFVRVYF